MAARVGSSVSEQSTPKKCASQWQKPWIHWPRPEQSWTQLLLLTDSQLAPYAPSTHTHLATSSARGSLTPFIRCSRHRPRPEQPHRAAGVPANELQ